VRPQIGMRVKLAARGGGRWQGLGRLSLEVRPHGHRNPARRLEDSSSATWPIASSCSTSTSAARSPTSARQGALNEAARVYAELSKRGAGLEYLDVGGGLGVDYDGSQTNFESSVNYTLQEYANDVVYHVQSVCDEAGVPHPTIISESGPRGRRLPQRARLQRARCVSGFGDADDPPRNCRTTAATAARPERDVQEPHRAQRAGSLSRRAAGARYGMNLFGTAAICRSISERWPRPVLGICRKIAAADRSNRDVPEELQGLDAMLSDTYFCNFSLFQSMPDSWAIKQFFPVMPIHRLNEQPTRHAVLGDITCDSDGKIDQFIDRRDVKRTLRCTKFNGDPYYLGAFLIGAYQEILGDLHNLFGDTNAVHVSLDDNGQRRARTSSRATRCAKCSTTSSSMRPA
jgi:arginine decarboxylase